MSHQFTGMSFMFYSLKPLQNLSFGHQDFYTRDIMRKILMTGQDSYMRHGRLPPSLGAYLYKMPPVLHSFFPAEKMS